MTTVVITVDPDDPATWPKGRIDSARVDATSEADIAAQLAEDEEEARMVGSASPLIIASADANR
jgi:putative transcriptional regulator